MSRTSSPRPGEGWSHPFAFGVAWLVGGVAWIVYGVILLARGAGQSLLMMVFAGGAIVAGVRYLLEARARRRLRVRQEQE